LARCIYGLMRHRLAKTLFREWLGTSKWEKLVLILPFIVLVLDLHILIYAANHEETALIISSGFVFILSVLEIIAALEEIHERIAYARKCTDLEQMAVQTVKDFPVKPTVGQVIEKMQRDYPRGNFTLYELYPVACDVLNKLFSDEDDGE